MRHLFICLLLLAPAISTAQPVTAAIHAANTTGPFTPIYGFFGYDEPNYTYTKNGRKLVGELASLSSTPVYIRTHFLLATGDGQPALKWGSTNAYTEDAGGHPIYDWTITDRIFDTYLSAGAKPFVEIGFMPEALSSKPHPYRVTWVPGAPNNDYPSGWTYPPNDYVKWGDLVFTWVQHCVKKYGAEEVSSWYWEVWNEPDISYWRGTPEEYDKLYDYAVAAVKRALPAARVGGPATTGPANSKAAAFLRQFLEHCDRGKNPVTGSNGAPLDFITYHAKGRPSVVDGHVRMGIAKNLQDVDQGFQIVASFPKFRNLPIVLSESDPEGCAACSARVYPPNAYRNGPLYASYTAAMLKNILDLAALRRTNIEGMLTWAFEFEDQPYFDGFRTLATNGIDKPVLNLFRMAGMMHGDRVAALSSGQVALETLANQGVRNNPYVDVLAVRADRQLTALLWNYHDDDFPAPDADVQVRIDGLPVSLRRILLADYRIDESHSNAWSAWKSVGSPQSPDAAQYATLEKAGQLQQKTSPQWIEVLNGSANLNLHLPRQAVSLLQLTW